ncbi:hypothetical protein EDD21DRAFT_42355 [Dissophora ornata]|nr:hypothetical protein EDD21DRAFT_42355 [Dissophora ornata]
MRKKKKKKSVVKEERMDGCKEEKEKGGMKLKETHTMSDYLFVLFALTLLAALFVSLFLPFQGVAWHRKAAEGMRCHMYTQLQVHCMSDDCKAALLLVVSWPKPESRRGEGEAQSGKGDLYSSQNLRMDLSQRRYSWCVDMRGKNRASVHMHCRQVTF